MKKKSNFKAYLRQRKSQEFTILTLETATALVKLIGAMIDLKNAAMQVRRKKAQQDGTPLQSGGKIFPVKNFIPSQEEAIRSLMSCSDDLAITPHAIIGCKAIIEGIKTIRIEKDRFTDEQKQALLKGEPISFTHKIQWKKEEKKP